MNSTNSAPATRTYFLIERTDAISMFFDERLGRDFGSPLGGWTPDRLKATRYQNHEDALGHVDRLGHMAVLCKVAPYELPIPTHQQSR